MYTSPEAITPQSPMGTPSTCLFSKRGHTMAKLCPNPAFTSRGGAAQAAIQHALQIGNIIHQKTHRQRSGSLRWGL